MRKPDVEAEVRRYLSDQGYVVVTRSNRTGPDIIATRNGKKLIVEVKGDRPGHKSSPATINVDVLTLLGQILLRKGQNDADEYAIAIRPVYKRLIEQAVPTLKELQLGYFWSVISTFAKFTKLGINHFVTVEED